VTQTTTDEKQYFGSEVIDGRIFVITIDRPEARNAFNGAMARQLEALVDRFDEDDALWVAILRGNGPTFSAGQDLKAARTGDMGAAKKRGGFGIMGVPPRKPIIAAVDGQALAGGMEMVLSCDLVVASEAAVFGLAEAKRGLLAVGGGCFRLPQRVPYHVAMEMILTGETKTAQEMHQHGLVNRVVPRGEALAGALELARTIARNSPVAVRAAKEIAFRSAAERWTDADGWTKQQEPYRAVARSEDLQEGLRAFAEKRDPVWKGR
jgi:enoyl-CoA hydratase